jgi:UDP-2,3-diacylglucosamine pyrophosphatase LpxH
MARAVIAGDLHLYYDRTNVEAVQVFTSMLADDPPDLLVLGGDIYELWRRDLSGAPWMASEFTDTVVALRDRGVDVVYVAGNHDDYLLRHLSTDARYPFEPVLEYRVTFGSTDIFVTHGHKYEPSYNPVTNDVLALTDDHAGRVADWLYSNRPLAETPPDRLLAFLAGPSASYFDPEALADNRFRRRAVETGIREETEPGEWGIYGHTHVPGLDEADRIANWGSMTAGQQTYVEIEDGEVRLQGVQGNS